MKYKEYKNPVYTKFEYVLNGKEGIEEIKKRKYSILIEGKKDHGGIYIIRNVTNEKFYIGSSVGIRKRWRGHLKELLKKEHKNIKFQNSWNNHNPEEFYFYIIEPIYKENFKTEQDFKERLFEREQYYLDLYQPFNNRGYNICKKSSGGQEVATMEDLKEGRLIISLEDFNNIMYMLCETDMTLGEIAKVIGVERHYIINIYLRNNLENLTEGYKFREKVKTKLPWIRENKMEEIKALREKGYNADKIAQELNLPLNAIRTLVKDGTLRHIKARTIYKFDLDGTFEGKYNSLKEAHESTFSSEHPLVDSTGIILCLKGERFQAGHKFWSESPDFTVPLYQKVCLCDYSIGNPVIVYDLDGIPLNGYKSSKEASRKLFNSENFYTKINNVCKNKLESYKGYKFKYAKEVPDEDLLYILKNRENSPQQEG